MKKLACLVLLFFYAISTEASTTITDHYISGHWTLAGSPYLIKNHIEVSASGSLTIDPGVKVIFQGPYLFIVYGILHATGTSSKHITFTVQDTTGRYDLNNLEGGWMGISYMEYSNLSTPDTSTFTFCDVNYLKNGSTGIAILRGLDISQCTFSYNIGTCLTVWKKSTGYKNEISNCSFLNNISNSQMIVILSDSIEIINKIQIHDNNINNNLITEFGQILYSEKSNIIFSNNKIYENGSMDQPGGWILNFFKSNVVILKNRVYKNILSSRAPLYLQASHIDINKNYICNNRSVNFGTDCYANGGGAMLLIGDTTIANDSSMASYSVRNNIISNNYANNIGGAICIVNAKVSITNNDIINNQASRGAAVYNSNSAGVITIVKNNILFGNNGDYTYNFWNATSVKYIFENNWIKTANNNQFNAYTTSSILGDSTTNIVGISPELVAPTVTADVNEDAMKANFFLKPKSSCIDKADAVNANFDASDYAGNTRISGPKADIGAFEFSPNAYSKLMSNVPNEIETPLAIYPNPSNSSVFVSVSKEKGSVAIYDLLCKKIIEKKVIGTLVFFDVDNIPKGTYIAVWNDGEGNKSTQKLIIE